VSADELLGAQVARTMAELDRLKAEALEDKRLAEACADRVWEAFGPALAAGGGPCNCSGGDYVAHEPGCGYEPLVLNMGEAEAAHAARQSPAATIRKADERLAALERDRNTLVTTAALVARWRIGKNVQTLASSIVGDILDAYDPEER
jgi:hypothetical protein